MRKVISFIAKHVINQVASVRQKMDDAAAQTHKHDLSVLIGVIINQISYEMGNRCAPEAWLRPGREIPRVVMDRVVRSVLYDYLDRVQLRHVDPTMDTDLRSRDLQPVFDSMMSGPLNQAVRVDNIITTLVGLQTGDLREHPELKSAYARLLSNQERAVAMRTEN